MTIVSKTGVTAPPQRELVDPKNQQSFGSILDTKRKKAPRPDLRGNLQDNKAQLKFYNHRNAVTTREVSNLKILLNSKTDSSLPRHLKPLVAKYERDMNKITDREDRPAVQTPQRDLFYAQEKVDRTDKLYNDIRHYTAQSQNPFAQRVISAIGGQAGPYITPK
jgi:hypothetical protein